MITKKLPNNNNLDSFQKKIEIRFQDLNLLRQVFVHRSYLNENLGFDLDHNERLEFLGDAVLELIVTDYLFLRYKNPEGELTNFRSSLVKGETISKVARELNMGEYLYLSRGEMKGGGRSNQLLLANTFEALVGAIYLDQGYDKAKFFVEKQLIPKLKEIIAKGQVLDSKSRLQELAQEKYTVTPVYKVLKEHGPDHAKSFIVGVFVEDKVLGEGSGSSKQNAEQSAASSALDRLQK
ncbi:ribonuclease III [Candidatus Berkelbacteria bacterium]|nr:ribonuclease III [Candidatus Berkelbacteria bacterium]